MFGLLEIGMFWLMQLALVAANPIVGALVFGLVIAGLVMVFQNCGWLWGFGALTLVGLVSGPALLLTPVILIVMLLARWQRTPAAETTHEPRPILLEPRDASRSR
jgi:hypothetical protein